MSVTIRSPRHVRAVPDRYAEQVSESRPPSLRDRKKDATRQLLEDTAWQLFQEQGYDATTVQDIADAANVAPRTFFRYFPSKEAVLYPELDAITEELSNAFAARPTDEPVLVSLVAAMDAISNELSDDLERKFQRFEMLKKSGQPQSAFVANRVAAAVEDMVRRRYDGHPDAEVQARLAAGIMTVVMSISNDVWLGNGAQTNLEDEARHCFAHVRELVVGQADSGTTPAV